MALAAFKDLVIDADDPTRLGRFWADLLGRELHRQHGGDAEIRGVTPEHMIWVNRVPEPKTVKQRVHLDIYTRSLADLEALGASVVEPQREGWHWTIMGDVEGGEFCAFLRDELPSERLHGLVVDSADPEAQAAWWAAIYEAEVTHHEAGWSTVDQVAGMPIQTMDFVPVPEPKTVKNRVHWDVTGEVEPLVDAGATVLQASGDGIGWSVLADPEGNEFCVFRPR
ncbi:MAG TPA: VOC family protein [Nocardioidaceae bacterium]|nr:VOC family protein [Nocardioidaceae bacterium]